MRTYIKVNLSAFPVIDRVLGVLLRDTLLYLIKAFARLFGPPLLEFSIFVVQPAERVEGMLWDRAIMKRKDTDMSSGSRSTHARLPYRTRHSSCMLAWRNGEFLRDDQRKDNEPGLAEEWRTHDSGWENDLYAPVRSLDSKLRTELYLIGRRIEVGVGHGRIHLPPQNVSGFFEFLPGLDLVTDTKGK